MTTHQPIHARLQIAATSNAGMRMRVYTLQRLAWRRQASSLFSPNAFARPLSSDI
jgi:hypothetical protein